MLGSPGNAKGLSSLGPSPRGGSGSGVSQYHVGRGHIMQMQNSEMVHRG